MDADTEARPPRDGAGFAWSLECSGWSRGAGGKAGGDAGADCARTKPLAALGLETPAAERAGVGSELLASDRGGEALSRAAFD